MLLENHLVGEGHVLIEYFLGLDFRKHVNEDPDVAAANHELVFEPGRSDLQRGQRVVGRILVDHVGHGELEVERACTAGRYGLAAEVHFDAGFQDF